MALLTYFITYCIMLFLIPYLIKNDRIAIILKVFIIIMLTTLSVLGIILFNGIGKEVYNYMVIYTIAILYSVISKLKG